MNYANMTIKDIVNWCVANKKTDWLKATAKLERDYKVYPRVKVDGKTVVDKTQAPTIKKARYSFIDIKLAFVKEFMPEIAPKAKEKEPSMYDLIDSL